MSVSLDSGMPYSHGRLRRSKALGPHEITILDAALAQIDRDGVALHARHVRRVHELVVDAARPRPPGQSPGCGS